MIHSSHLPTPFRIIAHLGSAAAIPVSDIRLGYEDGDRSFHFFDFVYGTHTIGGVRGRDR